MAIGKISDFKAALTLGGARPSLFDVQIYWAVASVLDRALQNLSINVLLLQFLA